MLCYLGVENTVGHGGGFLPICECPPKKNPRKALLSDSMTLSYTELDHLLI